MVDSTNKVIAKLEEYKTIYSDPIYVDVEGGYNNLIEPEGVTEKNKIQLSQNQFFSFKTKTKFTKVNQKTILKENTEVN